MTTQIFNQDKFDELQSKVFADVGGAMGILMSYIGDQSGVYKALEDIGPCSHTDLATKSGIYERYLREWLSANAAGGLLYDYTDLHVGWQLLTDQRLSHGQTSRGKGCHRLGDAAGMET